jgi:hypothetical protein
LRSSNLPDAAPAAVRGSRSSPSLWYGHMLPVAMHCTFAPARAIAIVERRVAVYEANNSRFHHRWSGRGLGR